MDSDSQEVSGDPKTPVLILQLKKDDGLTESALVAIHSIIRRFCQDHARRIARVEFREESTEVIFIIYLCGFEVYGEGPVLRETLYDRLAARPFRREIHAKLSGLIPTTLAAKLRAEDERRRRDWQEQAERIRGCFGQYLLPSNWPKYER